MNEVSRDEVLSELTRHASLGLNVDERVWREVRSSGQMFRLLLPTRDTFLDLIWQKTDDVRLLTPDGEPRTLRDIGRRIVEAYPSFELLAADRGLPPLQHSPQWFERCVEIDGGFDFDRFGWMILTPATEGERRESPTGTYYIFDGSHKGAVLAKRLLAGRTSYRPLEALLLTPRRG